jgi:hypothetical protein
MSFCRDMLRVEVRLFLFLVVPKQRLATFVFLGRRPGILKEET